MTDVPFGQWYVSESLPIANQEVVNLYLNIPQIATVTALSLLSTPGLEEIANAATDEFGRGFHEFNGIPYSVNGNNLYRIERTFDAFGIPSFNAVKVNGAVPLPGDGRVIMSDNGVKGGQLFIILPEGSNQFNAYIFTESPDTLTQVSDVGFDGPVNGLVYIDGFFLLTKKDGNKFFISNLRDGLAYTATDFADAEVDPDPIRAPFILKGELYIYGSQTIEPFQNFGGSGFPFGRIEGGVLEKGIDSPFTLQELNGSMVWIGGGVNEQPAIWRSSGGQPVKISTTAIDNQLRTYSDTDISNAFSVKYSQSGALFVAFTIPNEATFVYDDTTQQWHQRESILNDQPVPYRIAHIIDAYGELLVNDTISNKIGLIDKELFTEYGEEIRRRFTLPPIDNGGQPFFNDSIELVGETGVGLTDGTDPEVLMSFSDNGGRTFNNPQPISFGKIGEFDARAIWTQLGRSSRERMYKFLVSDPVKWAFTKVEVNVE